MKLISTENFWPKNKMMGIKGNTDIVRVAESCSYLPVIDSFWNNGEWMYHWV